MKSGNFGGSRTMRGPNGGETGVLEEVEAMEEEPILSFFLFAVGFTV